MATISRVSLQPMEVGIMFKTNVENILENFPLLDLTRVHYFLQAFIDKTREQIVYTCTSVYKLFTEVVTDLAVRPCYIWWLRLQ